MVDQHQVISKRDLLNDKLIGLLNNKLNLRKLSHRVETMRNRVWAERAVNDFYTIFYYRNNTLLYTARVIVKQRSPSSTKPSIQSMYPCSLKNPRN